MSTHTGLRSLMTDHLEVDTDAYRQALRRIAAAVTIITAGEGEARRGLTATAVCSLTVEPPMLLVCINNSSETGLEIRKTGTFGVNLLSRRHAELAQVFSGRGSMNGADRFNLGDWFNGPHGIPLLRDSLAAFACLVVDAFNRGSHTIFFGSVQSVSLGDPGDGALLYAEGRFAGLVPHEP